MAKKARVLVATMIGLITYRANDVIELDDKLASQLEKQGVLDTNPSAVAYAIEEGAEVQKHASPKKSTSRKNDQNVSQTDQDENQTDSDNPNKEASTPQQNGEPLDTTSGQAG